MHTKNFSYKSTLLGFVSDPFSHSERKVNSEGERDIYIYNNDEDVFLSISELKSARSFLRISCDQNRSLRGSRRVAKEARGPHPSLLSPRLPSRSPGRNSDRVGETLYRFMSDCSRWDRWFEISECSTSVQRWRAE